MAKAKRAKRAKTWKQTATAALRSVPKSAPFEARARALQAASKEYRGMKRMKRNPSKRMVVFDELGGKGEVLPTRGGRWTAVYNRSTGPRQVRHFDDKAAAKRWLRLSVRDANHAPVFQRVGGRLQSVTPKHDRQGRRNPFGPLRGIGNWSAGEWIGLGAFGAGVYLLGRMAR